MQPSKTFGEDEQLTYISGYNCIPEQANESFLATQKLFCHEPDGVRFYHFVQSFKIGEDISPQEANEIGMELAKIFENREVIVATHIDKDHLHNHIVVCSYDLESGFVEQGEQIHREDDEGSRGAERGNGNGFAQGDEGSNRTGWEGERESFRSYRQKNSSGRGTVVAPSRTHDSPRAVSTALMGARGIANVGSIIEANGEESEEEKRQREAKNDGTVAGALVGGAIEAVIELTQPKTPPTDDVGDGEDEGFDITM